MLIMFEFNVLYFSYAASVGAKHFSTSAKLNKGLEEMFLDLTKREFYKNKQIINVIWTSEGS